MTHPLENYACKVKVFTLPNGEALEFKELTLAEQQDALAMRDKGVPDGALFILASCTTLDIKNKAHVEMVKNMPFKLATQLNDFISELLGLIESEDEKKSSHVTTLKGLSTG